MSQNGIAIFTICSNNYMGLARVFLDSARTHHPDAALFLCLADRRMDDSGFYPEDCIVVEAEELDIPDFESFAFRYDIMEFNTALKPFMFRHLFEQGHRGVLYFDPDIEIFRRLDGVLDAIADGASFLLTPHLLRPAEGTAFPDDIGIMQAGVFNLGFLGVGAHPESESLLRWWSRRLQYQCVNEQAAGIFVDQKFMDLIPGFSQAARILHDPTLNVAYWNLSQRALVQHDNMWLVDGEPLGFFHFSGINPDSQERLSKYTDGFRGDAIEPPLQALMRHYSDKVKLARIGVPAALYPWDRFRSGTPITPFVRRIFREDHLLWAGDPFETFEEYLHAPSRTIWSGPAGGVVTNLMDAVRIRERWLLERFQPDCTADAREFVDWMLKHGAKLVGESRLIEPIAMRMGEFSPPAREVPGPTRSPDGDDAGPAAATPDIDVLGYLRLALGLGEAGRLTVRALDGAGLRVGAIATALNSNSAAVDDSCAPWFRDVASAPVQLFSINADQLDQVVADLGDRLRPDAYRIVTPFWELDNLPDIWIPNFALVDEVWAPSRFIQATLLRKIDKPIIHMPLVLDFEPPEPTARRNLRLPEDRFLFFFAFDYFSFLERKNPRAVLEAFHRAFPRDGEGGRRPALVLKTLNGDFVPDRVKALHDVIAADPDVILIEQTLSRADTLGLIGACDAVVSLHRSEGLGLLVAEAMVLGKPVISTDYSATTELVSTATGYPVDYRLIAVGEGEYPFHEGQHWADADLDHAAWQMRSVAAGHGVAARVAAARDHIRSRFGMAAIGRRQRERLRMIGVPA